MNPFLVALQAESLKVWKSKVFLGTLIFFAFIAVMMGLLLYVAGHPEIAGRSTIMSAKAAMLGKGDWPAFFGLLLQLVLALGTLGTGIATSWVFGREYSDRTIKDLLALPIARTTLVMAKFVMVFFWSVLLCLILFMVSLVIGWMIQIPGWSNTAAIHTFKQYSVSGFFTILLCTPVAYFANVGRGYILPMGYTILTLIVTQLMFVGLPEVIQWIPWALPALNSGIAGPDMALPGLTAYAVYTIFILAGLAGTIHWWLKADHV